MVTKDPSSSVRPEAVLPRVTGQLGQRQPRTGKVRTCVGCRQEGTRDELVRMVLAPGGEVAFDLAGGAVGRGAWVHPQASCLRKASKVVGQRLSSPDALTGDVLPVMLAAAARRRATGLLLAANRAKLLAVGSHACRQSFLDGKVKLVVLAADALAAGKESWVETATAQGLVVFWSTKAELGGLIGRNELAVLTVLDGGLARSLVRVFAMMIPAASHSAKQTFSAWTTGLHGSQDSEDG